MNESIKAKIAKLLRMSASSNPNEAANAADMVHKLCSQYGLSPAEIDPECDAEENQPIQWSCLYMGRRRDAAQSMLLGAVVRHFNGEMVFSTRAGETHCEIFASKGRKLEIEIYFEYLVEVMNKLADEGKQLEDPDKTNRSYKNNFKKAFASAVNSRLFKMREAAAKEAYFASQNSEAGKAGLVALNREEQERKNNASLLRRTYPRLGTAWGFQGARGSAGASGRAAGNSVGLNKQMSRRQPLALSGS